MSRLDLQKLALKSASADAACKVAYWLQHAIFQMPCRFEAIWVQGPELAIVGMQKNRAPSDSQARVNM